MHQVGFHYTYTFFDQNATLHTVMSLRIIDSVAVRFLTLKNLHFHPHRSKFLSIYSVISTISYMQRTCIVYVWSRDKINTL